MTTRVCHSKSLVTSRDRPMAARLPSFERDIPGRVMVPAFARPAHRKLRAKLADIAAFGETSDLNTVTEGSRDLGIITDGVCALHAAEASPGRQLLQDRPGPPAPISAGSVPSPPA